MKLRPVLLLLAGLLLVSLGAAAEEAKTPELLRALPAPALGLLHSSAAAGPGAAQQPQPVPRITVRMRPNEPQPSRLNLLPRNFSTPATAHSRLRGPFEQAYPRLW